MSLKCTTTLCMPSTFYTCFFSDAHARWRVNGRTLYITYLHVATWWWKDMFTDQIANIPAGQQFWVEVNAGCGQNAAHAFGGHQRIEVEYRGVRRAQDL